MLNDSRGGRWEFRPTLRALRKFEGRSGVGLFSRIGQALPNNLDDLGSEGKDGVIVNTGAVARLFTTVIDGFNTASALLFECRFWTGDGDEPKLNFDQFCDRFETSAIGPALIEAVNILVGCVASTTAGAKLTIRQEDGQNPLAASGGRASTD